ncbi:MAG: pyridoxal phosphate-dependent aminotransferase [Gammaproteobacteria bacterium]|nr:pyridoxal phosphate-dependent aminotransferase [Gammaproteobacteria bacterium]MDP2140240.1 pyridoxal phosphate-dependent aminotransferase [Gammaproteobacteria bacterium]MDP2348115.1 pyridoxal phosphate-dependent aminotransferase [Gammaproteobacteria bacterium]
MSGAPKIRFKTAERLRDINPFRVMTVLERARTLEAQGRSIVHLEVGEPDFVTAPPILKAGRAALAQGRTGYTPAAGLPQLRERIAVYYSDRHGVTVAPERIFVTPGASGALTLLAQMLLNPGDGVLMTDPGYPCNRNFVRLAGAEAQLVPVSAASNFQLTRSLLERYGRPNTRGVWVASPGNPTGTVLMAEELRTLSQWCDEHDTHLLVDEIYHGLDYIEGLPSALQISADTLVVNSFSKYFGMTGWRLGWFVVPDALVAASNILAQNLFIAASTVAQYAALRAFDPDTTEILEQRRHEFAQRRDFLSAVLQELGFSVLVPTQGAFYIYAGIEKFSDDSEHFCQALLEHFGVAVTPGTDFGNHENRTHVRFAFTTGMEQLQIAAERLRTAVNSGKLSR